MHVISFEGFEYSGKSTQIALLKKYFLKKKNSINFYKGTWRKERFRKN